jgi:hypothetical protein
MVGGTGGRTGPTRLEVASGLFGLVFQALALVVRDFNLNSRCDYQGWSSEEDLNVRVVWSGVVELRSRCPPTSGLLCLHAGVVVDAVGPARLLQVDSL